MFSLNSNRHKLHKRLVILRIVTKDFSYKNPDSGAHNSPDYSTSRKIIKQNRNGNEWKENLVVTYVQFQLKNKFLAVSQNNSTFIETSKNKRLVMFVVNTKALPENKTVKIRTDVNGLLHVSKPNSIWRFFLGGELGGGW